MDLHFYFLATGFNGLHVIIGTMFIITCYMRISKFHMLSIYHTEFELAAWYWHFVDVMWLFLYLTIYWWSK